MGSRFPLHQLSGGLYVSGKPEPPKEKPLIMTSTAMPYTGGDIKKSGELGKMFDLHVEKSRKSGPLNAPSRNGSFGGAASHSGPINATGRSSYSGPLSSQVPASQGTGYSGRQNSGPLRHGDSVKKSSGPQSGEVTPMARQNSGPLAPLLPTTGLITSGPISSGPLNSSGAPRKLSGPLEPNRSMKLLRNSIVHNQAVTKLNHDYGYSFNGNLPKPIVWSVVLLFVMGFIAGGFILGAVHNAVLLMVVVIICGVVVALFLWNSFFGRSAIIRFITDYPDAELRNAKDGQYVKVSGVVTCGNVPLESSFHKVPRCVYTSTSLYEYRGWESKAADFEHKRFTWRLRSLERHVADFYISDFQSGLRALVKTGYGARVTPYIDEPVVVDINPINKDLPPEFLQWLHERNLSSDNCTMRLKERYIKEGSTVSVMGVVQRNDSVLMIVSPSEPFSTGCQWPKCILPASLEGIVMTCEDNSKTDVIPV